MNTSILEVQRWANATYSEVPGYVKCAEDGTWSLSTVHALTRALQHELGIDVLSDSFSPGTLAKLVERAGITLGEPNRNLVRICQGAFVCRGYHPGVLDGTFGPRTQAAVASLMSEAGLGDGLGSVIPPKVVKALLSRDTYMLAHDGLPAVRAAQRWLNGRYSGRRDFFVVACDGRSSRGLVDALVMAVQFELGLTDDQSTGVFGTATRDGLRTHVVEQGQASVWVRLFSAGLVVNGRGVFGGVFGEELAEATRDFQEFSALEVTSRGDYPTWAQLLTSNGDPTRAGTACDCITTITPSRARALYGAGYRVVGRYLDQRAGKLDKKIKPGELQTIFDCGLKVFPISQYDGRGLEYFSRSQGNQDARDAHVAAAGYGFDIGTVIYFAVDFDATQADVDSAVVPYFEGVVAGLAAAGGWYRHGVYGARNVCAQVTERTRACWSFIAGMSTGYSGNKGFPLPENWAFNQIQTLWVGEGEGRIQVDKNAYRPGTDAAVCSVRASPAATIASAPDDEQQANMREHGPGSEREGQRSAGT